MLARCSPASPRVFTTAAEFNSMENLVSGDIYIGGGETDAIKLVTQIAYELQTNYRVSIITYTAETQRT